MGKAPFVTMMWVPDMLSKLPRASLLLGPGLSFGASELWGFIGFRDWGLGAYELWGLQGFGFRGF